MKRATAVSDWRKGLWQHFNPRLREEGDKSGDTSVKELSYFNPRPREEGDAKGNNIYRTGAISIHALVKRATLAMYYVHGQFTISIHALVKRATLFSGWISSKNIISIHALVKRATHYLTVFRGLYRNFNPRPREEGDSTGDADDELIKNFNPRPREEGDPLGESAPAAVPRISIHALVKRATEDLIPDFSRKLFQSTPS